MSPLLATAFYYSPTATQREYALNGSLTSVVEDASKRTSTLLGPRSRTEAPVLVRQAAEFAEAIASVLPVNEAADRRIDALFARQSRRAGRTPLARR
jgi:hypothetical protein